MSKITATIKPNGKSTESVQALLSKSKDAFVNPDAKEAVDPSKGQVIVAGIPDHFSTEVPDAVLPAEEKPVASPLPIPVVPEMTIQERINRVETLKLLIDKRASLSETLYILDRFQVASNDFNCTLKITDSDNHLFSTSFTPGIKKVIEFLKEAFRSSISEVESRITF